MKCKLSKLFFLTLVGAITVNVQAQTDEERRKIVQDYDQKALYDLGVALKKDYEKSYEKALEVVKAKNLPISGVNADGSYFELKGYDFEIDEVVYFKTFNNVPSNSSIQTARAQHLYNGGSLGIDIEGRRMNLGIWDGGQPQSSHPNLGIARVLVQDGDFAMTSAGQSGISHATHVAGTMIGNGARVGAKGIAFRGNVWANTWTQDLIEMKDQAGRGLLVSNHSYGADNSQYVNNFGIFGRYNRAARDLDALLFLNDKYQPVYAAGNDREGVSVGGVLTILNPNKNGFDLMVNETVSKNAVVVAAIKGFTEYTSPLNVEMTSFSQWGPTDDYRVKPDISAKGFQVLSSSMRTANSVGEYETSNGTSMAAPAVTAVFALWQQYHEHLWRSSFMRSASLRALMAHTASPAYELGDIPSDGPNAKFGWGVINAEGGAKVLKDAKAGLAIFKELTLQSGEVYELAVDADGTAPLIATIAWTDKEGREVSGVNSTNPVLVNDLDLRIVRPNTDVVFPFYLNKSDVERYARTGDNDVDNIEKVVYKSRSGVATQGVYKIRVSHKRNALDSGVQKYTLIVTGGVIADDVSVDNKIFDKLSVYPNPATDVVNISADYASIENASVAIYDMLGKQVYLNNSMFGFSNEGTIDVSSFSRGVYIVKISKDGKAESKKIILK
nr:S8/S53 family peptidase [uncultured Flavobacterium sp.]